MKPLYADSVKVEARLAICFYRTDHPYSAKKLNASALLPPGVFLAFMSIHLRLRIRLLLRALPKCFSEGSLCCIGVALCCMEVDWLITSSCKARGKKIMASLTATSA